MADKTPDRPAAGTGPSAAPPGAACTWGFGDGTTGAGSAAVHTYASPGTYTVILTSGGETARASVVVSE